MAVWLRRLADLFFYPFATRERRRTTVVMMIIALFYSSQYARAQKWHFKPHGDGFFSWAYATSLAIDFDLDLTNDYTLCGRPDMVVDEGGGRPANPFYFGPAMIWAPILFVVRIFLRLPANASAQLKHACSGPYVQTVGATSVFFTMLTMWIAYRVARRWVKQPYALVGALVGAFGTTLVTYGAGMWFYSHLWSALGVSLVMLTFVRATEKPELRLRWYLFGLAVAFAMLQRPQEGCWSLIAVVWAMAMFLRDGVKLETAKRVVWPAVMSAVGFASLFWVQLVVYKKIYGVWWLIPQGKLYVQVGHAHPFMMLFSNYSGWFVWSPLAWLGLIGTVFMLFSKPSRLMGVALLVGCALDTWLAASVLSWGGGGTWGNRTVTSLAPAVVVGAAVICQTFGEWVLKRRDRVRFVLVLAVVFPLMFVTWGTSFTNPAVMREPMVPPYGAAVGENFKDISTAGVGNPFSFPATQIFKMRYRVPREKWDDLAFSGLFIRHWRTGQTLQDNVITFATPDKQVVYAEGIVAEKEGGRISSGRARILISLYWPWITHLRIVVKVHEQKETTLKLTARGFFYGKTELGSMVYAPGREDLEWTLPKGGLDSGINEVLITSDGDITLKTLEFIDRTKHDLTLH